jgi:hypothetical protein
MRMQLITLHSYPGGFRGCVVDTRRYCFFQYRRKSGFKILKSYPKTDFVDLHHFLSMMQKFMTPSSIIFPPVEIEDLSLEALERMSRELKERSKRSPKAQKP